MAEDNSQRTDGKPNYYAILGVNKNATGDMDLQYALEACKFTCDSEMKHSNIYFILSFCAVQMHN